jgi:hypothetical protein
VNRRYDRRAGLGRLAGRLAGHHAKVEFLPDVGPQTVDNAAAGFAKTTSNTVGAASSAGSGTGAGVTRIEGDTPTAVRGSVNRSVTAAVPTDDSGQ